MFALSSTITRKAVKYNGENFTAFNGDWSASNEFIPLGSLIFIPELSKFHNLPNMGNLNRKVNEDYNVQGFKRSTNQWFGLINKENQEAKNEGRAVDHNKLEQHRDNIIRTIQICNSIASIANVNEMDGKDVMYVDAEIHIDETVIPCTCNVILEPIIVNGKKGINYQLRLAERREYKRMDKPEASSADMEAYNEALNAFNLSK